MTPKRPLLSILAAAVSAGVAALPLTASAGGDGLSADAWVRSFYAKEPAWSTPAEMRALFTPELAQAIIKDTGNKDEVGAIDFAFTCGCQDGTITEVKTASTPTPQGALVTARFKLEGKPTRIDYRLARAGSGWKIADVSAPSQNGDQGWSLRRLLKLKP